VSGYSQSCEVSKLLTTSFKDIAADRRPPVARGKIVPWQLKGGEDQSLLTQFEVPTHGATQEYMQLQMQTRPVDSKWVGRCGLCLTDVVTSWEHSTKQPKKTSPSSSDSLGMRLNIAGIGNIEQHACARTHQCAILAYKKGVRDSLKRFAQLHKVKMAAVASVENHVGASVDLGVAYKRKYKNANGWRTCCLKKLSLKTW
jgi:hypothetical protein